MGFFRTDLEAAIITVHHPGALSRVTYRVDGHPYCLRPLKQEGKEDQFCSNEAGQGTAHLGTGPCNKHNGNIAEGVMVRYGKYLKRELKERYEEFASDDARLMDLYPELAMLKTILTTSVDMYQESRSARALELVLKVLNDIGNTVERMDRIQSRQVITAAMAKLMFTRALQTAVQFVPPEQFPTFVEMWRANVSSLLTLPADKAVIDITPKIADFVEIEHD